MLSYIERPEHLAFQVDAFVEFFTELKKKLDDCDLSEIPEEVLTDASRSLDWLLDMLFMNTPKGLLMLLAYLYPEN